MSNITTPASKVAIPEVPLSASDLWAGVESEDVLSAVGLSAESDDAKIPEAARYMVDLARDG